MEQQAALSGAGSQVSRAVGCLEQVRAAGHAMAALVQNKAGEAQSICQQLASAGALIDFGEDERVLCAKKGLATLGPAWVQEPVQTLAVAPMDADAVAAAAKAVAEAAAEAAAEVLDAEVCPCALACTPKYKAMGTADKKQLGAQPPSANFVRIP